MPAGPEHLACIIGEPTEAAIAALAVVREAVSDA